MQQVLIHQFFPYAEIQGILYALPQPFEVTGYTGKQQQNDLY
jgi:hypothetical protein